MADLAIPFRNDEFLAAELNLPPNPCAIIVLAHGSSPSGKNHPLLAGLAAAFAERTIACLRFDFPFVTQNKTSPNSDAVLDAAFIAALAYTGARFPGVPLIAAGKSLGARAAARVVYTLAKSAKPNAREPDAALFLTYPLHPAGRMAPSSIHGSRGVLTSCQHSSPAAGYPKPMLFIAGTRDPFANCALMREFAALLPRAELYLVDGGDHALRCAREPESIIEECAAEIARWLKTIKHAAQS
ncbi:MAG: hypothetical protein LBC99_07980 [Spirochaetota bacterium]|jgi:predicted alpha/beta-hydrolase family hydrolase|nr:hypothetical protein [Spirochaetota bacterium]